MNVTPYKITEWESAHPRYVSSGIREGWVRNMMETYLEQLVGPLKRENFRSPFEVIPKSEPGK